METVKRDYKNICKIVNTGKITSAKYIKKDGSLRNLVFRSHVTKGISGEGLKYNPEDKGYITAFDMQIRDKEPNLCWRILNTNTLISIKAQGKEYAVID